MDGGEWLIHEAHGRWRLEIQDWQAWTFTLSAVTMETSWPEKHQTSTNIKGGPQGLSLYSPSVTSCTGGGLIILKKGKHFNTSTIVQEINKA